MVKIVCINNVSITKKGQTRLPLTIGKVYSRFDIWDDDIIDNCLIIDDDGETNNPLGIANYYHKSLFITLEEWRDSKLESIGI